MLGVVVAAVVTWLSGAERDLGIQFGTTPLLPLRGDWVNQSLMLAVTVLVVLLGAHALGLPPEKAAISVMLLTVTPHFQAMILKGELRLAGAFLAVGCALGIFLIVVLLPAFCCWPACCFLASSWPSI